jgi:hypothetical protein
MLFELGKVVATPRALELMEGAGISRASLLKRHASGDWGEVSPEVARENDHSLVHGFRVISCYPVVGGAVWVVTEASRGFTTMLLPEEY